MIAPEVVLDEALGVARFTGIDAEVVLQKRERANATCELNPDAPRGEYPFP